MRQNERSREARSAYGSHGILTGEMLMSFVRRRHLLYEAAGEQREAGEEGDELELVEEWSSDDDGQGEEEEEEEAQEQEQTDEAARATRPTRRRRHIVPTDECRVS